MNRLQEIVMVSRMSRALDRLPERQLATWSIRYFAYPVDVRCLTDGQLSRLDDAALKAQRARRAAMAPRSQEAA